MVVLFTERRSNSHWCPQARASTTHAHPGRAWSKVCILLVIIITQSPYTESLLAYPAFLPYYICTRVMCPLTAFGGSIHPSCSQTFIGE